MNIDVVFSFLLAGLALVTLGSIVMVGNIDFFIRHTGNWKIPGWRWILAFHKHESTIDGGIS